MVLGLFCLGAWPATANAQADLAIEPGSNDFGSLRTGDNRTSYLEVWNRGLNPLTLGSIGFAGDPGPFSVSDIGCTTGLVLEPDWGCDLPVTFAPSMRGDYAATVSVETADGSMNAAAVLTGSAYSPGRLVAVPSVVNFGTLAPGAPSQSQSVSVRNDGDTPVTVVGTGLISSSATLGFAADADACLGTIHPGSACSLIASFHPPLVTPSRSLIASSVHFQTSDGTALLVPLRAVLRVSRTLLPGPLRRPVLVRSRPTGIDYGAIEQELVDLAESVPKLLRGGPRRTLRLASFKAPTAGRLTLRVRALGRRTRLRLATAALNLETAAVGRLQFKLGSKARKLLRERRRTRVKVVATFRARATGETYEQALELAVRRPAARRPAARRPASSKPR